MVAIALFLASGSLASGTNTLMLLYDPAFAVAPLVCWEPTASAETCLPRWTTDGVWVFVAAGYGWAVRKRSVRMRLMLGGIAVLATMVLMQIGIALSGWEHVTDTL